MSEDVCPHGHVGHMKFRVATGKRWCTECELTRSRERRKYSHRGQTVNLERLSRRRSLQIFGAEPVGEYWRPKTREDCSRVPRPCPFVACKWHLFVDVTDVERLRIGQCRGYQAGVSRGRGCASEWGVGAVKCWCNDRVECSPCQSSRLRFAQAMRDAHGEWLTRNSTRTLLDVSCPSCGGRLRLLVYPVEHVWGEPSVRCVEQCSKCGQPHSQRDIIVRGDQTTTDEHVDGKRTTWSQVGPLEYCYGTAPVRGIRP